MNRHEINWQFATYVAAVVSGVVWAVLAALAITSNDAGGRPHPGLPGGVWALAILTSVALLAAGAILTWVGRTIVVRSWGVALCSSAVIGWLAMASIQWASAA